MVDAAPVGLRRARIGLRGRLVLAFLALAVLIAVSGSAGLVFVSRVGNGLLILADVATPLLQQSGALMANAEGTRQVLRDVIVAQDPAPGRERLGQLAREAEGGLARLRTHAGRADTGLDVNAPAQAQEAFRQSAAEAIGHDVRRDQAIIEATKRHDSFE